MQAVFEKETKWCDSRKNSVHHRCSMTWLGVLCMTKPGTKNSAIIEHVDVCSRLFIVHLYLLCYIYYATPVRFSLVY